MPALRFATNQLEQQFWRWYTDVHLTDLDAISLPFDAAFHVIILGVFMAVMYEHGSLLPVLAIVASMFSVSLHAALLFGNTTWYIQKRRLILLVRFLLMCGSMAATDGATMLAIDGTDQSTLLGVLKSGLRYSFIPQTFFFAVTYVENWVVMTLRSALCCLLCVTYKAGPLCQVSRGLLTTPVGQQVRGPGNT